MMVKLIGEWNRIQHIVSPPSLPISPDVVKSRETQEKQIQEPHCHCKTCLKLTVPYSSMRSPHPSGLRSSLPHTQVTKEVLGGCCEQSLLASLAHYLSSSHNGPEQNQTKSLVINVDFLFLDDSRWRTTCKICPFSSSSCISWTALRCCLSVFLLLTGLSHSWHW